jgi:dTDP-glucose 4,6-dehydratase
MTALITGAAGFLGSHLCDAYLRAGANVVGVDSLATSNGENLAHLRDNGDFRFIRADITSEDFDPDVPLDLILHFASPASPIDYARDPIGTLNVNGPGTERCCKLARERGARVIFASTSEIYGDPLVHPQPEAYWGNVNSFGERSCYDEGKRFGEAIVFAYRRVHGIDARLVRIFNTYGPRMRADDGRVVPTFILQALRGEPLSVFGDGSQTRSLCYVDDLIDGIMRFAEIDDPPYPVVNLGSEHEVTVNDIAAAIAQYCGVALRTENRRLPPDDPSRRRPDLSRARSMLQWEPRTPLEEGMRATISWFRSRAEQKETASL